MEAFAEQMHTMIVAQTYIGNNPTVNQTGLKGAWDFDFKYTQKPPQRQYYGYNRKRGTACDGLRPIDYVVRGDGEATGPEARPAHRPHTGAVNQDSGCAGGGRVGRIHQMKRGVLD